MAVTKKEIIDEARNWPDEAVADLIDGILLAKHGDQYLEEWNSVARRRVEEIRSGLVQVASGDQVTAKVAGVVGK